jgi:hypothetical protein
MPKNRIQHVTLDRSKLRGWLIKADREKISSHNPSISKSFDKGEKKI